MPAPHPAPFERIGRAGDLGTAAALHLSASGEASTMLRITSALDHFETSPLDRNRLAFAARFYLDRRGHAWRLVRGRSRWRPNEPPEPGEFTSLDSALHTLRHLRGWYREPQQTRASNRLAHLARWRIVRATAEQDGETVERFDVVELATLPETGPEVYPPSLLRPYSLDGWALDDWTAAAHVEEARSRASAERWETARRREFVHGAHDWTDRDGLLKIVRPSRVTLTASAHYAERAGRWRRVESPAEVWRDRDTVEVVLRLNDPRLAVAVYKQRGRVETFHQRRACRVWYGYDSVLDDGAKHRAVRAPAQQAAAIRALLDRARLDLAGDVQAECDRKRRHAAERRAVAAAPDPSRVRQLALFG
ncbi:hypothetical protein RQM47_15945 [Rubrivirga sp. S365]|uniref:hypothetical protein n=1 Tax=Rubrivirga sp. S365 TaxID=3076080 RepID=UPI0028CA328C|nr:hypothetical protein [Rubrivirga sp. S365]MDT7858140.1 hypothetical protein [Rubrivirga sp. S365]